MTKSGFPKILPGIFLVFTVIVVSGLTVLLFVSRHRGEAASVADPKARNREEPAPRPARGRLAVVIDDGGYDNRALDDFLRFPGPLAVSVLPGIPGSGEAAEKIRAAGKELLLHLPMEALGGEDPGPGAVLGGMDDETARKLVVSHIASLPGVVGANNHMGSRGTADPRLMSVVLGALKEKSMFFLDSRTTPSSVGRRVAESLGLPFLERGVFLDNETDKAFIREALTRGKTLADTRGHAVMIGHVWCSELAEVLLEVYPELLDEGYRFYPLTELLQGDSPDDGAGN